MRNDQGQLHFRVLSIVNGIEMPFGEAPPGAQGVLPWGQSLRVGAYNLTVTQASGAVADAWAALERDASGVNSVPDVARASFASGQSAGHPASGPGEDDPFGDWGFENPLGPETVSGDVPAQAATGDLAAFYRGLGLDPAALGGLSQGELEAVGKTVRAAVLGLLELRASSIGSKQELHAEDRTMVAVKDNNPLHADWPDQTKLQYLFGGRAASIGFINPERALHELLRELLAHEQAVKAATQAAMEGVLREFDPASLKTRLLGAGSKLFEGARAWDAYVRHYQQNGADAGKWARLLLARYFAEAYLKESRRAMREGGSRPH